MAFSISGRIPGAVSARTTPAIIQRQGGLHYDVSIAELQFVYAITDQTPYTRETIDFHRQQIDTSPEPGEQSLSQWWVRDEDSWHRGAGINWYDPGSDGATRYRFHSSMGIDPWTKGEIKLHKKMDRQHSVASGQVAYAITGIVNGADCIFVVAEGSFYRYDGFGPTAYTSSPIPGTEPVVAGAKVLVGSTSGILAGDITGSSLSTLWTTSSGTLVRPWWAKSRIIAAKGPSLYDLTLAGGDLDAATALWTHPSSTFTWTDVTESPGAILASGYDGGYGFIFRFTIDTTTAGTGLPTLSKAIQTSEFPPGETVHAIQAYLGAFIAIGSSKGVRIGTLGADGVIQYGPLTISTTHPVRSLSARDSYVYAGIEADLDGKSGVARINIAEEITEDVNNSNVAVRSTLRYAWAYDAQAYVTGAVQSCTFLGLTDRVVVGIQGAGIYVQSASQYETTGYLTTGRMRFATSEPKSYQLVKMRANVGSSTTIAVSTIDFADVEKLCFTLNSGYNTDSDIALTTISEVPQSHASLKFVLTSTNDGLVTPFLQSFQLKATPVPRIQRLIQMPLQLQDREQDRNGAKYGYLGSAWDRLSALEAIEQSRNVIVVNDWTNGESFTAQIKSVRFQRVTPPARNEKNFGGILLVQLVKL